MLRILDRLDDTPAEIVTELGVTLRQTPTKVALTGDTTRFEGPERSSGYRWLQAQGGGCWCPGAVMSPTTCSTL